MDSTGGVNNNVNLNRVDRQRLMQNPNQSRKGGEKNARSNNDNGSAVRLNLSEEARKALESKHQQHGPDESRFDAAKVDRLKNELSSWQGLREEQLDTIAQKMAEEE
mgnify:FL=1